jgi:hypothetical protein
MDRLELMEELIQLLTLGMTGTALMKADAVRACTLVLERMAKKLNLGLLREMVEIMICLLKEEKKETFKGLLTFGRKVGLHLPPLVAKDLLPKFITTIFETADTLRFEFRFYLKRMLLKLVRKVGEDQLSQWIPE